MFFVVVWPPPCWRRTRRAASTGFLVQYLAWRRFGNRYQFIDGCACADAANAL